MAQRTAQPLSGATREDRAPLSAAAVTTPRTEARSAPAVTDFAVVLLAAVHVGSRTFIHHRWGSEMFKTVLAGAAALALTFAIQSNASAQSCTGSPGNVIITTATTATTV